MADYAAQGGGGGSDYKQPIDIVIEEGDAYSRILVNGEQVVPMNGAEVSVSDDSSGRAKISCNFTASDFWDFVLAVVDAAGMSEVSELVSAIYPVTIRHTKIGGELRNGVSGFFYRGQDNYDLYACGTYANVDATEPTGKFGTMIVKFYAGIS